MCGTEPLSCRTTLHTAQWTEEAHLGPAGSFVSTGPCRPVSSRQTPQRQYPEVHASAVFLSLGFAPLQ